MSFPRGTTYSFWNYTTDSVYIYADGAISAPVFVQPSPSPGFRNGKPFTADAFATLRIVSLTSSGALEAQTMHLPTLTANCTQLYPNPAAPRYIATINGTDVTLYSNPSPPSA